MHHKMIVMLAAAFLCVAAWAVPNVSIQPPVTVSVDGEASGPTRNARVPGDIPAGYRPRPAPEPTLGEPPQLVEVVGGADGGAPVEPKPLWGPDVTVFDGQLKYITPYKSERMIAYDRSSDGTLFAAFTVQNGDTAKIYRSTDGGNTWAYWNAIRHTGNVLTSLKLVVAEGDSDFVFFFVKSSAGNGDIYVGRWALDGSTADVFSVKVDSDTIANFAACADDVAHYYLYVAYEGRAGDYDMRQLRSTNYGITWAETGGEVVDNETSPKPDICFAGAGKVIAVFRDRRQSNNDSVQLRIKRTTDRGSSWDGSKQISTLVVPVYDPVIAHAGGSGKTWVVQTRDLEAYSGMGLGICFYYSPNDGDSWDNGGFVGDDTDADEQMPSFTGVKGTGRAALCYVVTPGESVMATMFSANGPDAPVRVSDSQCTGFFAPQAGSKDANIIALYAGYTAKDLYFDAYSMTGAKEGSSHTMRPTRLEARPSPAFDRAVISYNLPGAGPVRVSVLDVAGREVAVPAQGTLPAGTRSAVWDCREAPAGVYLIRVDAGSGSQSGRLVVSH